MGKVATKDKMEFTFAMARHTKATMHHVQRLLRYAATFQRLKETACNRELTQWEARKMASTAEVIRLLCENAGAKVHFQSDPRGCCVKVVAPDGYTNDWGKEGICVPA